MLYIGYTSDLKKRIAEHTAGKTITTKWMLPIKLIYYEAYRSQKDAKQREQMLKQYGAALGHLRKRISKSLQ
jgi:putative endonuclease